MKVKMSEDEMVTIIEALEYKIENDKDIDKLAKTREIYIKLYKEIIK